MAFSDFVSAFRAYVQTEYEDLLKLDDKFCSHQPAPGKWSNKEIIGHLVDSAIVNQQRFIRVQFQEDMIFAGYDQDAFVKVSRYNELPWKYILELWRMLNLNISRTMEICPPDVLVKQFTRHNLDEVAFTVVPRDKTVSPEYFFRDYAKHMEHHLKQIRT